MDADSTSARLPGDIQPRHYALSFMPNLEKFTFLSTELITLDIMRPTSKIVLHAKDLRIHDYQTHLHLEELRRILFPEKITFDDKEETITFEFPEVLPQGPALLQTSFEGTINDQMCGMYRSKYKVGDEERFMAATQFEATDARRVFPCIDEPAAKATFEVRVIVPSNLTVISNTPVKEETKAGDWKTIVFETTPVMSTYLLALIIGELEHVETTTPEGTVVRVWTTPGKKELGRLALDVASRSLSFFNHYFDTPYPLPKLDLIALPDFASGAMENWGAVTYRETALLIDEKNSSAQAKQRVTVVIAHELAHQWFGNLVTMEWWTHLWLNESFATWISYRAVDEFFPEWRIWEQFVVDDFRRALTLDSLRTSHPIEVEVRHPSEIREVFDDISYSKGASMLRMLVEYLGEDAFRKGLHNYLTRHSYTNASTDDLWTALEETSGKPIKTIMEGWTKETGYPVLSLNGERNLFAAHQSRFFIDGDTERENQTALWHIPLAIRSKHRKEPLTFLMESRSALVSIPFHHSSWLKWNTNQVGLYRVNYPPHLWREFPEAITAHALGPLDRLGVENDAFALSRAGLLPTEFLLKLLQSYTDEDNYTVWADLFLNLTDLERLLTREPYYWKFLSYCKNLYCAAGKRLGWGDDTTGNHLDTLLRSLVIGALGHYDEVETVFEARRRFNLFYKDRVSLAPSLRAPVYATVIRHGGNALYERVLEIYRDSLLVEEKVRCLTALGMSQNPKLLSRTLEFSLSEEVRPQDAMYGIASVARNREGKEMSWKFLKENWQEIDHRYGRGAIGLLKLIIAAVTENFATEEKAKEVEEFFSAHPAPAASRTIAQSVERIRSNAVWLQRDGKYIGEWLEKNMRMTQASRDGREEISYAIHSR